MNVLAQLSNRLGVPLSFGENRQCCMVLDQKIFVSIEALASGWLFTGLLKPSLDPHDKPYLQHLLALNLTLMQEHGGSMAYDPASGALLYASRLPLSQLNGDSAYEFLGTFVDQLESLSEQLGAQ
jgi:hypothetical protein